VPAVRWPLLVLRAVVGGVLMGLANLVPGISGGTMLLASGIYPRFIGAIAELTRFTFRFSSLLVLGMVVISAALSVGTLAGVVKDLVVDHRWVMYALFIGLTLGGVPVIWRMIGRPDRSVWIAAAISFAAMGLLAWYQMRDPGDAVERSGFLFMVLAGVAAASAMILPGVSGGYLFLLLGVYLPVLAGIDQLVDASRAGDLQAAIDPFVTIVLPVGIGVIIGVVAVSNLLKWLLQRFEKPTLGALLGLLVGAVVGLWPFQEGVKPAVGQVIKGRVMTEALIAELPGDDYPTRFFTPAVEQVIGAVLLIVAGFAVTAAVARIGREKPPSETAG